MSAISEKMNQLLNDETVSEIMVDGPKQVYVEREGKLEDTGIQFASEREIVDWANGILAANGWEPVGEGRFWAEGRLPDWGRFVVVIPPVAVSGPNVVVRKFPFYQITWPQLLEWGCVSQTLFDFFKVVMQAHLNVLVSGGTASGKTTLTNLLLELIPGEERLITVSQRQEFRIDRPRVVHLEAEAARASGGAEITLIDLLRVASNMRPDHLIVGELVGPEVIEVIRLMNLGHEGMVTLMHANSPRDALTRLETMATVAEPSLTLPAIRAEIASALHLIVQQSRLEDGSRKVVSVVEVQDIKGDSIVLQELFRWEKTGMLDEGRFGRLTGVHKATGAMPSFMPHVSAHGLAFPQGTFEA